MVQAIQVLRFHLLELEKVSNSNKTLKSSVSPKTNPPFFVGHSTEEKNRKNMIIFVSSTFRIFFGKKNKLFVDDICKIVICLPINHRKWLHIPHSFFLSVKEFSFT